MQLQFKSLIILFFIAGITSCQVSRNYHRPEGAWHPGSYRNTAESADSSSIADLSWEQLFTDVKLRQYIAQALDSNFDMQIAVQNLAKAELYLKQAKAGFIPQVSGQATYSGIHPSGYSSLAGLEKDFINQYDLGASLSWEADIWGKIRNLKAAAKAQFLMTEEARKTVRTTLIASVASVYYHLLALDKQASIAAATVKSREESLTTIQLLKDAGIVTATAVKQTEAQLYDAQITLLNIQKLITQSENFLSFLTATAPQTIERSKLEDQQPAAILKTGVPSQLLGNRPDVKAAELKLISAFHLTKAVRASLYPSLNISLGAGLSALEVKNLFTSDAFTATLAGGLIAPVLNRRQLKTQYQMSLSDQEIALLNFKRTFLDAIREVSDALEDYKTATSAQEIQEKQVAALLLATDYSQQLMNNGMANYLEVLTARQQTLATQLQLVNTNYNRLNSIVQLYRALGGGSD